MIINPVGERCAKGHLQAFDLQQFDHYYEFRRVKDEVVKLTKTRPAILYCFKHFKHNSFDADHRIVDAFVLTTISHKLLRIWYIQRNYKIYSAIREAVKYITN
jgi:hypothetical protein